VPTANGGRVGSRGRSVVVWLWLAALVVAVLQAWAGLHRPLPDRLADLQVYLGSVWELHGGGSLYDFAASGTAAPFTYPPFAGLLFGPLIHVPFGLLAVLWSAATVAAVVGIAFAASRTGAWAGGRPAPALIAPALIALALFCSAPVSSNLRFGQVSVFLVALVLLDALRMAPARWCGLATGLAAAIKLTPLIFIPYYWLSGRRRAAAVAAATFAVCAAVASLIMPGESARFWLSEIWNVNRVGNLATGGNQSLNGALLRWELPERARSVVVAVVGLAVVVVALIRAVRAYRNDRPLTGVVLVGAAGLVLSPVSWTHHQVWLVLAALLPVPRRQAWWTGGALAVMILPVTSVGAQLPGGAVAGDARLWLAIAVACLVPFVGVRRRPAMERVGGPVRMG
jgi:alpha-1,2-mannosyltransferase